MTLLAALALVVGTGLALALVTRSAERLDHPVAHWGLVSILGMLIAVLLFRYSDPTNTFEDFKTAYYPAGVAVLESREALAPVLLQGVNGFVNLPVLAYLFAPLALLPAGLAMAGFWFAGMAAAIVSWWLLVRSFALDRVRASQLFIAFAASAPLHYSLREANTSHFLLLALVLGLTALRLGRERLGGAFYAVAALIKPPLIVIGLYQPLLRRWWVFASGVAVIALAAVASVLLFGWPLHEAWLETTIRPYGEHPMPAFNVQSIAAWLLRIGAEPAALLRWEIVPLSPWASVLSNLATGVIAGLSLFAAWRASKVSRWSALRDVVPLGLALLVVCLVSPLAWSHYYVWLLLPLALWMRLTPASSRQAAWLLYGFVLLSVLPVTLVEYPVALQGVYVNLLVSNLMWAGLLLWAALVWRLARRQTGSEV